MYQPMAGYLHIYAFALPVCLFENTNLFCSLAVLDLTVNGLIITQIV